MLFLADNLASFSYSLMDEPLFVVQQLSTVAATIATKTIAEYSDVSTREKHRASVLAVIFL